jgi:hypothetical protein
MVAYEAFGHHGSVAHQSTYFSVPHPIFPVVFMSKPGVSLMTSNAISQVIFKLNGVTT